MGLQSPAEMQKYGMIVVHGISVEELEGGLLPDECLEAVGVEIHDPGNRRYNVIHSRGKAGGPFMAITIYDFDRESLEKTADVISGITGATRRKAFNNGKEVDFIGSNSWRDGSWAYCELGLRSGPTQAGMAETIVKYREAFPYIGNVAARFGNVPESVYEASPVSGMPGKRRILSRR